MNSKFKITIPNPCNENWNEMTPTEKGRFCSVCNKNVVDFTKSSDREIVLAYNENPDQCGRFRNFQLNRKLIIPKEKKSFWKIVAASVISFLGFGNHFTMAQEKQETEQTDKKTNSKSKNSEKMYYGIVYNEKNKPIPRAKIRVDSTDNFVYTDEKGVFEIMAKKGDLLIISYRADYLVQNIYISENTIYSIKLEKNPELGYTKGMPRAEVNFSQSNFPEIKRTYSRYYSIKDQKFIDNYFNSKYYRDIESTTVNSLAGKRKYQLLSKNNNETSESIKSLIIKRVYWDKAINVDLIINENTEKLTFEAYQNDVLFIEASLDILESLTIIKEIDEK